MNFEKRSHPTTVKKGNSQSQLQVLACTKIFTSFIVRLVVTSLKLHSEVAEYKYGDSGILNKFIHLNFNEFILGSNRIYVKSAPLTGGPSRFCVWGRI